MKFLKAFTIATLFIVGCYGLSKAQNPYAIVRIYESAVGARSGIHIAYEDGTVEEVTLPVTDYSSSKWKGNEKEILRIITKTINQMTEKGYKVVGVTVSAGSTIETTTYTMEKVK